MADLVRDRVRVLFGGGSACHASMSPDNTYRIMHIYSGHRYFGVRNAWDRELWRCELPDGFRSWQTPRFSNHPNVCTAVAAPAAWAAGAGRRLFVVRLEPKAVVRLDDLEAGWLAPHLWLPSGAELEPASVNPAADVELARLTAWQDWIGRTEDWDAVLAALEQVEDPEARQLVEAIEAYGRRLMAEAAASGALDARAIYREVADRFGDRPLGQAARRTLASASFERRLGPARKALRLASLAERLRGRAGDRGAWRYDDPAFFARNRAVLVEMAELAADLRTNHPDSGGARLAATLTRRLHLPEKPAVAANERLVVEATVEAASRVPTYAEIAPYTEAVTFVRYRVDRVVEGDYDRPRLVAVHWGMRDRQPTAAATWPPGLRQRLVLDRFAAHPELETVTAATEADDLDLPVWWALEVERLGPPAEGTATRPEG
jgi:hypothetical protein